MRITMNQSLEDCFDESLIQEIGLDSPVTREFIEHLGPAGTLQYFPAFSRPFFKLDIPDRFTITGIEGKSSFRVTLCHEGKRKSIALLEHLVSSFDARQ